MAQWKAIRPKKINKSAMLRELKAGVEQEALLVLRDYEKTVKSWDYPARFKIIVKNVSNGIQFSILTYNKVYYLVDETGAKPHPITPKKSNGSLAIPSNFTPKTKVGVVDSQPGGRSGQISFRKGVSHPGFKPRKFSEAIAKISEKRFLQGMRVAMANAVDASGHRL